jgi:hypothetical protein
MHSATCFETTFFEEANRSWLYVIMIMIPNKTSVAGAEGSTGAAVAVLYSCSVPKTIISRTRSHTSLFSFNK